jgi:hypothetical protein
VFAEAVVAVELVGPSGERVPALVDPAGGSLMGTAFLPVEELTPGAWVVMAQPSEAAENYGDGSPIELGSFAVSGDGDVEAPVVTANDAQWTIDGSTDTFAMWVTLTAHTAGDPAMFELDFGDRDTLMDGVTDANSGWTQAPQFSRDLADAVPEIAPESASVRVRAVDASGNVGPWSAPMAIDVFMVMDGGPGRACAAAPGRSAPLTGILLLAFALIFGAKVPFSRDVCGSLRIVRSDSAR